MGGALATVMSEFLEAAAEAARVAGDLDSSGISERFPAATRGTGSCCEWGEAQQDDRCQDDQQHGTVAVAVVAAASV